MITPNNQPTLFSTSKEKALILAKTTESWWLKSSDSEVIKVTRGISEKSTQSLKMNGTFAEALIGESAGDQRSFGNGFEVVKID